MPKQDHLPVRGLMAMLAGVLLYGCVAIISDAGSSQLELENSLLPVVTLANRPIPTSTIEERMARYQVPGVSIALIEDGKIEWVRGYGRTRMGGDQAILKSTPFQSASVAKVIAAVTALRLVQEGKLDLDTDINVYLRTWKVPVNKFNTDNPVTLRKLLSHRAGINVGGFSGYAQGQPLPSLVDILNGQPPANSAAIEVDAVPGTSYRYSGGGYTIVQQLIEEVEGKPFQQVVSERILRPLSMEYSAYTQSGSTDGVSGVACGHGFNGLPVEDCWYVYPELASAGLWSTPADLARLGLEIAEAFNGNSNKIINHETAQQMLLSAHDNTGLGPGVHGEGDSLHFDHSGWNRGYRSYMRFYPRAGKGIVVLANGDGGHDLINEIVATAGRLYRWPDVLPDQRPVAPVSSDQLEQLTGDYVVTDYGLTFKVERQEDHLVLLTPRGSWYTLFPSSTETFFTIEDGSELRFAKSSDDNAQLLHVWGMVAQKQD